MSNKQIRGYDYRNENNQYMQNMYNNVPSNYQMSMSKRKSKVLLVIISVIMINVGIVILYCMNDSNVTNAKSLNNEKPVTTLKAEIPDEEIPVAEEPVEEDVELEPEPTPTPEPVMLESLKPYYEKNNDLIGWLSIEDTPINNPVMFTPQDECYYLEKDFDGNYFKAGTLFIDDESRIGESDTNIIIYGHNMKNQTMFGSLKKYAQKNYYDSHKYITFNTLYEEAKYEVMAAFYAKVLKVSDTSFKYYRYTGASTQEEHDAFMNYLDSVALYETNIKTSDCTFGQGERYITLSTCSYHTDNGRFVVVAKKVE